jgi:transposase
MIDYQTYCQIRHLFTEKKLGLRQVARELKLGLNTVCKWARRESFKRAPIPKRASKLDPFKGEIIRLLAQHAYSAQQIFQRLKEQGYQGRYTILKAFVRQVRPKPRPAFLTLHFEPGECAQVDWGCAGSVPVGSTRRRLSFFLMVLAFSRKLYLEFTLAETLEHFLCCHQHAFEYFGGVVRQVWVDNCKVAVLSRAAGSLVLNPRYLDFANHHGFQIRACGVGQPQEKGTRRKRRRVCQKELPQRPGPVGFSTRQSGGPLLARHRGQCPGPRPDPQNAPGTLCPGKAPSPASAAV